jgi:DNA-binding CsgD family transcriptional regulator
MINKIDHKKFSRSTNFDLGNLIVVDKRPNKKAKLIVLNYREVEFLKLACTEMTYKEIAEYMYVSPRTIDGYRDILFEKLGIKSRVGLVLFAIKNGIIIV